MKYFGVSILFVFFFSIISLRLAAQQKITVIEDPRIVSLVEKHKYLNQKQKISGWRVQIFFESGNNSKKRAHDKKGIFMAMFPEQGVYLMFQSPYYKVRVGDFRTRMDAEGFKQKLLDEFPDAFVVKDEINFPEL
ncbi:MAG: SPOR domain-containing protein [Bacteroidales bacterium]|jgi:hypothetical protein|nr:SPOR domain-containing protein [Bacteroidales bacterium]